MNEDEKRLLMLIAGSNDMDAAIKEAFITILDVLEQLQSDRILLCENPQGQNDMQLA